VEEKSKDTILKGEKIVHPFAVKSLIIKLEKCLQMLIPPPPSILSAKQQHAAIRLLSGARHSFERKEHERAARQKKEDNGCSRGQSVLRCEDAKI
jgi:hypothetical protein